MEQLEKYFPVGNSIAPIRKGDVQSLVIALVLYVIGAVVTGLVLGLLTKIPVLGFVFWIIGILLGLYVLVGIILSVLKFIN